MRPINLAPVPVPPGCPGLPDRDTRLTASPRPAFGPGEWSDARRARVSGASEGRVLGVGVSVMLCRIECARLAYADDVPLLVFQRTPACRRCARTQGKRPAAHEKTDRPRFALVRHPAKGDGILQTRVPSTVATQARERIAPLRFPCRPPAHAAHTRSLEGASAFDGALQAPYREETPDTASRERCAFETRGG
jgi:hypothetical protein